MMRRRNTAFLVGILVVVLAVYLLRDGLQGSGSKGGEHGNAKVESPRDGTGDRVRGVAASSPQASPRPGVKGKTRWVPGLQIDYALHWNQVFEINVKDTKGSPVHVRFAATWRLTVTDVEQARVYVRSEFLKPSFRADAYPDELNGIINQQLKAASYLVFSQRGAVQDALFLPEIQLRTRMLARASTFAFQFVHPVKSNLKKPWMVREQDMTATYRAQYEPAPDGRIKKTKPFIYEERASDSKSPIRQDQAEFRAFFVTDRGWPERAEVRDQGIQNKTQGSPAVENLTTASIRRVAVRSVPSLVGSFSREKANYKSFGRFDEQGLESSRAQFKKNLREHYTKGASVSKVLERYRKMEHMKDQWKLRTKYLRAMIALFEENPQQSLEEIKRHFDGEPSDMTKSFLFSVLEAAGTKEAQDLLLEQVAAVPNDEKVLKRSGLVSVARSRPGSVAAIDHLTEFAADPENATDKGMAMLGIGNQLGDLMEQDPEQGEPILNDLVEQFNNTGDPIEQAILLSTLGNVGDPVLITLVEQVLSSPHEIVRSAAAFALRLIEDPRADDFLGVFLRDQASLQVRKKALSACEYRSLEPLLVPVGVIMIKDPDTVMRRRAITMVGSKLYAFPQMVDVMKISASHDADATNRTIANGFVESYESGQLTAPDPNAKPAP